MIRRAFILVANHAFDLPKSRIDAEVFKQCVSCTSKSIISEIIGVGSKVLIASEKNKKNTIVYLHKSMEADFVQCPLTK